ncbi:MAG TPA: UDP-N-acetylmuramate--L-alanine ligase, partial [Anaerolineales bacterium]|nr:UDP-N-acetylmuramate--L-alanine ligase [Anaerolineales bacterium]
MSQQKHIHLIGIGGAGLSAIATVLLARGYRVSGSDRSDSAVLARLRQQGAQIFLQHQASNVQAADFVLRSSAVPDSNPEVQAARQLGIPVVKRQDYLASLMAGQDCLAVAGSHGKTTTSAMLSYLLVRAELSPGFIVGGELPDLGTNAAHGTGKYFVIEADEYDHMFLGLRPKMAIVTNMEHDHPDLFPTEADVRHAFEQFVALLPPDGLLIACADDAGAHHLAELTRARGVAVQTYALSAASGADWVAEEVRTNTLGGSDFLAVQSATGKVVGPLRLSLAGLHNVSNALAVVIAAQQLHIPFDRVLQALRDFRGVGRRFELKGQVGGVTILDDYAHHPTELRATLASARRRYPTARIWAMFQPHTFSRTRALLDNFAASFADADGVHVHHLQSHQK